MFDYAKNLQLALKDIGRRVGMQAGAAVVMVIGAGFLLAALWTFLAHTLDWGSLGASLAIGLLFLIIGFVVLKMGQSVKHPVPSTDELKAEVETRVSLAADAALEKARVKATEVVDTVEHKVHNLVDSVSYKANELADTAEAKVQGFTRNVAGNAAAKVGLTPQLFSEAQHTLDRVKSTNAAAVTPLLGAFAAGVAIASRLQSWRQERDRYDDYDDDYQYGYDDPYDDGDRY